MENLRYLTSEQALQDAASFIEYFKQKHGLAKNKWIVFGGSYAGSLAAWLRLKYPHLVAGAIASSAPVQAVLNFDTYFKVVNTVIGPKCSGEIRTAMKKLSSLLQTKDGWRKIDKLFNLCQPLDGNNKMDVFNLVAIIAGRFAGAVQYNKQVCGYFKLTVATPCRDLVGRLGTQMCVFWLWTVKTFPK